MILEESPKDEETNAVGEELYAEPLTAEEIRWFYKDGVDKRWVEFCGYDSLRIEKFYQDRQSLIDENSKETNDLPSTEKIVVRGGMYDVEIDNMKCVSIYWPGKCYSCFYSCFIILLCSLYYYICIHVIST